MKKIFNIIIVLVIIDAVAAGALWFGYSTMQDKKAQEGKLGSDIAAENQKGTKLASLRHTLDLAQQDQEILEKYLLDPSEESQIRLISQMEGLGSMTTGASVVTNSLDLSGNKIHGEFTLTGTWAQIYHVLSLIELMPTRIEINRFSVTRSDTSGGNGKTVDANDWRGSVSVDWNSLASKH